MRPQKLALSAFGPFAGEQAFDFAALGAHRLFLIHGPTGAGKTTLLDALCFALFGCSSGDERQPAHLRSQHADAATPTWVELDFAIGAAGYRIRRSPAQPAVGRGGRVVTQQPKIALYRHEAGVLELIAEQERPVRAAVEALLGYAEDEFRQVVVLPQGRFREVLTAAPPVRQAILATLFRTSLYRRIEQQIFDRARDALDDARRLEQHRGTLLGEAGAATPEEAATLAEALVVQRDEAEAERARLRTAADLAAAHLVHARDVAGRLQEAAATKKVLENLREREAAMAADRGRLTEARQAATTLAADALRERAEKLADRSRAEAETTAQAARTVQARLQRAVAAIGDVALRVRAIEAGRADATRLSDRARTAELAEAAQARADAALRDLTAAQTERANAEAAGTVARGLLEAASRCHADAARLADMAEALRGQMEQARGTGRDLATAATLGDELRKLVRLKQISHVTLDRAAAELDTAIVARLHAEAATRVHHAAGLARHLIAGEPCPVCGSPDHPVPVADTEGDLPDLDAAGRGEAEARTRHAAAQDGARRADDGVLRAQDQLARLRERLPDLTVEDAAARVEATVAQAAAAETAVRQVPSLAKAAQLATTRSEAAAGTMDAATKAVREREGIWNTQQGALAALRADAPADGESSAALAAAAEVASATASAATGRLDADRAELSDAREKVAAAQSQAAQAASQGAEASQAAASALAEWRSVCAAAGFAEPQEARAARLAPAAITALEAQMESFDHERAQAEALSAQAQAAAEGLAPPDLPGLEAFDRGSRLAAEAAAKEAGIIGERYRQSVQRLADIREAESAMAIARDRHATLRDLADATGGKNERRLSLEGFVLASILDEALAAANHHLGRMLGGRYRVRRREEPGRANAAVGLEIEVLDEWTGLVRPANTLSGGEGFCAALALALGLADTVQAHAGARRIDTLFIDEGFGSLDEDALDTAMDVLTGLQAGDRLVGIISHVAELRARIPAQLVVQPGTRGSSGRFVTPR